MRRKEEASNVAGKRTGAGDRDSELVEEFGGKVDHIISELNIWGQVHHSILATEEGHTKLLTQILDMVTPTDVESGGVMGDLLRRLLATLDAHTAALARLEGKVDKFIQAITEAGTSA
jgi:hypothetical protein